jgi:hypothetical protein
LKRIKEWPLRFKFAAVKQINKKLRAADGKFRALTSLNQSEYDFLLPVFDRLVCERLKYYTLKGMRRLIKSYHEASNSSLYGSRSKLDFLLMYLKENVSQVYHGCLFGIGQSKVSEWVSFLVPVLESCLDQLGFLPGSGSVFRFPPEAVTDYLIGDVTERSIPRRKCYEAQQAEYSGKKKQHTVKNLAICDSNGRVVYLGETCEGSMHDKSIFDDVTIDTQGFNLLLDLGFQGVEKNCPSAVLPYKKPKNKELSELKKSVNKGISKERVLIENVFARMKRLKIIGSKIRLRSCQVRHMVIMLAAGIHNLRNSFRNPLLNYS